MMTVRPPRLGAKASAGGLRLTSSGAIGALTLPALSVASTPTACTPSARPSRSDGRNHVGHGAIRVGSHGLGTVARLGAVDEHAHAADAHGITGGRLERIVVGAPAAAQQRPRGGDGGGFSSRTVMAEPKICTPANGTPSAFWRSGSDPRGSTRRRR